MNIKAKIKQKLKKKNKIQFCFLGEDSDDSVAGVIDVLSSAGTSNFNNKNNETSFDDGFGGRIELDGDQGIVKK
jgi:hypothetical protein